MKLESAEIELIGAWVVTDGKTVEDPTCQRIMQLILTSLEKITVDESGWNTLYRDPQDNRLWELTYPQSESHGGGPPRLTHIALDEAKKKYKDIGR